MKESTEATIKLAEVEEIIKLYPNGTVKGGFTHEEVCIILGIKSLLDWFGTIHVQYTSIETDRESGYWLQFGDTEQ